MVKKLVVVFAVCLLLLFVLSCTVGNPEGKTSGGAEKTKVVFMYWGTPDEKATVEQYIVSFEKKHPDIEVQRIHVPATDYPPKLQTMIAGGTPPDVMYMGAEDFPRYATNSVFLDLQPFINNDKDFHVDAYYPALLDQFKYRGDLYGVAKDFTTLVLYYNKDLFDKSKVAYPNDKWTWKDFRTAAEKLTIKGNGEMGQYGFVVENWIGEWVPWIWQNNGEVMSEDGTKWLLGDPKYIDNNVQAFEFLTGLMFGKNPVAPGPSITTDQGTMEFFKTGKVAMCTYGRWACMDFKNLKFHWDVSVLPMNKKRASTLLTVCYAISGITKHPKESWELVKYLTGSDGETATAESGQAVPSIKSIAESDHFLKSPILPPMNAQAFTAGVPYSKPSPTNPIMGTIGDTMKPDMDLMWLGKQSPRDTIKKIQPKIEKLIKDANLK
jgi:multiple sugar transport system substrate-binding protein